MKEAIITPVMLCQIAWEKLPSTVKGFALGAMTIAYILAMIYASGNTL